MSSLTYKCVFYRPEPNAKAETHWIEFWRSWSKTPNDRAQWLDEKNGVICLVIMFTSSGMACKMSEMANFSYFLLITVKN